jgi:hypothetical protein
LTFHSETYFTLQRLLIRELPGALERSVTVSPQVADFKILKKSSRIPAMATSGDVFR